MKPALQRPEPELEGEMFAQFKLTSGGPYWRDAADTKSESKRSNRTFSQLTRKELGLRLARDTEG